MITYLVLAFSFALAFNILTVTRVIKEWEKRGIASNPFYRIFSFLITVVLFPLILICILITYEGFVEGMIEGGIPRD